MLLDTLAQAGAEFNEEDLAKAAVNNMDSSIKIGSAIALLALIGAAYAASVGVWTCRKCQLTVKSEGRPQLGDCPKGGGHHWQKL